MNEEARRVRESHLRAATACVLDARDLLTRGYEPAALPQGLAAALTDLLREIEKAEILGRVGGPT